MFRVIQCPSSSLQFLSSSFPLSSPPLDEFLDLDTHFIHLQTVLSHPSILPLLSSSPTPTLTPTPTPKSKSATCIWKGIERFILPFELSHDEDNDISEESILQKEQSIKPSHLLSTFSKQIEDQPTDPTNQFSITHSSSSSSSSLIIPTSSIKEQKRHSKKHVQCSISGVRHSPFLSLSHRPYDYHLFLEPNGHLRTLFSPFSTSRRRSTLPLFVFLLISSYISNDMLLMNRVTSAVFLSSSSSLSMHGLDGYLGDQNEKTEMQNFRQQLLDILGMIANQPTHPPPSVFSSLSSSPSNSGCIQKQDVMMFDPIEDDKIEMNSSLSSLSIPPKPSPAFSSHFHSIDGERNKKGEDDWDWIGAEEEEEEVDKIQSSISPISISNDLTLSFLDYIEPDYSTSNPLLFASKRIRSLSSITQENQKGKDQISNKSSSSSSSTVTIHRPSHSFRSFSLSIPSSTSNTTRSKPSSSILSVRYYFILLCFTWTWILISRVISLSLLLTNTFNAELPCISSHSCLLTQ